MNTIKKIAAVLLFGLSLVSQVAMSAEPQENGSPTVEIAARNRAVTFINNLADIALVIDGDEAHVAAVEQAVRNASVYVNGHLIDHGESLYLPIVNDSYEIQIIISAAGLRPFFKTLGFFRAVASFVEIKAKFSPCVAEDENEVELLYPLIAKAEQWNANFPSVTIGYSPFLKIQLTVEDLKA